MKKIYQIHSIKTINKTKNSLSSEMCSETGQIQQLIPASRKRVTGQEIYQIKAYNSKFFPVKQF